MTNSCFDLITALNKPSSNMKKILDANLLEISKLDTKYLRKFSFAIYKNFDSTKNEKVSKIFQSHLASVLKDLPVLQKCLIYKNLNHGVECRANLSEELLRSMIKNIAKPQGFDFVNNEIVSIIKFIPHFTKYNIEYESAFSSYLSHLTIDSINKLSNDELKNLLLVLTRIGDVNKYFDVSIENQISIYKVIEDVIASRFESLPVEDLVYVLRCFIYNDRGEEDLIRKLETRLSENLNRVDLKVLSQIPNIYSKRILFNQNYIVDNIYKPLYDEVISRFDHFDSKTCSYFLFNYWRNSGLHGLYCDGRLRDKLFTKMKDFEFFDSTDPITRSFLIQNILSYLSHARQLDDECIKSIILLEKRFRKELSPKFYLRIVTYLSRSRYIDEEILNIFILNFPQFLKDSENNKNLYLIYLNFKHLMPPTFSHILNLYTDTMIKTLRESRFNGRQYINSPTQIHSEIIGYLEQYKKNYEIEYFDEYFFDIAFPKEKVCIEILGPGHYIYPSFILNGRTKNKIDIIEKMGWKYHIYPFTSHRVIKNSVKGFLNVVLPFNESN